MNNKPEDHPNLPLFNCSTNLIKSDIQPIYVDYSTLVPNPKTIRLEDSMESWMKAVKELQEAAQKGGGIGIDLTSIKDYNRKEQMIEGLHNIVDRIYLSTPRRGTPMIFDTEEAIKAISINRQLGTQTRGLAEIVKTIKKRGKK